MMKPTMRGRGEMADALVLGTSGAIREGSTPSVPTTIAQHNVLRFLFVSQSLNHVHVTSSYCMCELVVCSCCVHVDLI